MQDVLLSILMLAGLALTAGALVLWRRGEKGTKPWLMLVAALVMFGNIAIWAVPLG
jgi:hypothetical protein